MCIFLPPAAQPRRPGVSRRMLRGFFKYSSCSCRYALPLLSLLLLLLFPLSSELFVFILGGTVFYECSYLTPSCNTSESTNISVSLPPLPLLVLYIKYIV